MILSAYLAAMRLTLATVTGETLTYTDALLTEGLRQALREYDQYALPIKAELTAVAGYEQSMASLTELVELVLIAVPWEASAVPNLAERVVQWSWVSPGVVWLDYDCAAGEKMLVMYRKQHTVDDLDSAASTTVLTEHERLLVLGGAAWSAELHYRQASDSVKGMSPELLKRMYTWSSLRLRDFKAGLSQISAGGGAGAGSWRGIGL